MNKRALAAPLSALLLLGCVCTPIPGSFEQRSNPRVTLESGRIVVSPDPLYFAPGERGTIRWHVARSTGLRFAPRGIEMAARLVAPPQRDVPAGARKEKKDAQVAAATENIEITCSLEAQKTADEEIFACENPHTKPGVYKYWIRVINGSTEIELDPFIMNM